MAIPWTIRLYWCLAVILLVVTGSARIGSPEPMSHTVFVRSLIGIPTDSMADITVGAQPPVRVSVTCSRSAPEST